MLKAFSASIAILCALVLTAHGAATFRVPVVAITGRTMSSDNLTTNGFITANETVTCSITMANLGRSNVVSISAELAATNGITPLDSAIDFGDMPAGGAAVTRQFHFTVADPLGRVAQATLIVRSNGGEISRNVFDVPVGDNVVSYSSLAKMEIPAGTNTAGPATIYPSVIHVANALGTVAGVRVTLHNYEHSFAEDVNALLISPKGTTVMLMSDCGGPESITNVNLTFSDTAGNLLTTQGQFPSGTYAASDYNFPNAMDPPAPAQPDFGPQLDAVRKQDPNGDWLLYIDDRLLLDVGAVHGGWSLTLTLLGPPKLFIANNGDGRVKVTLASTGKRSFLIDYSTDLVTWTTLGQVPAGSDTAIFTDPLPTDGQRFYRARRLNP